MATLEQLSAALIKADAAGNAKDAKALADAIRQMQAAPVAKQNVDQFGIPGQTLRPVSIESPLTLREKITGVIETPAALAANLVSGPITYLAGAGGPEFQKKVAGEIQYQPRTRLAQQTLEAVGKGLEASKIPPFMPMIGGTANALAPAVRATPAITKNALTAVETMPAVVAAKTPFIERAAKIQETKIAKSYENAPRIDAAKDALDLGIALNPAVINPTTKNKLGVSVVGNETLNLSLAQQNLNRYTAIAKEDLGLPSILKLDEKAFQQARNLPEVSGPYNKVRELPLIAPDAVTLKSLDDMKVTPLVGDTGQAANANKFIDTVKFQIEQGVDGKTLVDSIRQRRRDAQRIYKQESAGINPPSIEAVAKAEIDLKIANTLENLIESNINDPKLLNDFRNARSAMAKTYDYERATNFATGQLDPQVIAKMAAEGKPMSGKLAKIGNIAANFPEVSKSNVANVSTFNETLPRSSAAATVGAAAAQAMGVPFYYGLTAGAVAGNVAGNSLAKRMATQKYQASNIMPPDYRPNKLSP